jgi:hypothetical protein
MEAGISFENVGQKVMKHTPTPWEVNPELPGLIIGDDGTEVVAATTRGAFEYGTQEAPNLKQKTDAEHIVKCANTHDELVAALRRAVSIIEDLPFPENLPARDLERLLAKLEDDDRTHLLSLFRVTLHEEKGDKHTIVFDCQAEDAEHAYEQAENAYPNGEMLNATKL